jgi:hypothetical protein
MGNRQPKRKQVSQYRMKNPWIKEAFWWQAPLGVKKDETPEIDVAQLVTSTTQDVLKRQRYLYERDKRHLWAFMNTLQRGLGPHSYSHRNDGPPKFTYNLLQDVIDSLTAHFAVKQTRPQIVTDNGDPSLQRRARLMQMAVDGIFYETDYYEQHARAIFDGSIFDFGDIHHMQVKTKDGLRPGMERGCPWEIIVDEVEAFYGHVRNLGVHRLMAADHLAELDYKGSVWEGVTEHLAGAIRLREDDADTDSSKQHMVSVVEFWHPDAEYGTDTGRHYIGISNWKAVYEPWKDPIPHEFFRWMRHVPIGWRGQGMVERLYGLNDKLGNNVDRTQKTQELSSVKIAIKKGSEISKNSLTNEDYAILEYLGDAPPVAIEMGMIPTEWLTIQDRYIGWGKNLAGVSEMMSHAEKPAGITAASALEDLNDVQSARLANAEKASDDFVIRNAKQLIRNCDEINRKMGGKFEVMCQGPSGIKAVRWADVRVDEADYRLKVYAANLLPTQPSAKLQRATELTQQIPEMRPFIIDLLDFPDVSRTTRMLAAPAVLLQQKLQQILETDKAGVNCACDPSWDQDLAVSVCTKMIALAEVDDVDEERIERLRRFRKSCLENKKAEAAAMQPQANVNAPNTAAGPGQPMPLAAPTAAPAPVSAQPGMVQ